MKIDINKKEYRLLVDMLYLSQWMMHANKVNPKMYFKEHQALQKKLLSYYKEMEAEEIIKHAQGSDDYFESHEYVEAMQAKFIEPYNKEVFWDELISKLAERDLITALGTEEYQSLDWMGRVLKLDEIKERYVNEFAEHGLKHMRISYEKLDVN